MTSIENLLRQPAYVKTRSQVRAENQETAPYQPSSKTMMVSHLTINVEKADSALDAQRVSRSQSIITPTFKQAQQQPSNPNEESKTDPNSISDGHDDDSSYDGQTLLSSRPRIDTFKKGHHGPCNVVKNPTKVKEDQDYEPSCLKKNLSNKRKAKATAKA